MASLVICKVHPVVLVAIVDAYERRESKEGSNCKSVGTLLGTYDKGVVEVTNCYCVPHAEVNNDIQLSTNKNKEIYDLTRSGNTMEMAVGWFSTNADINDTSLHFHNYYQEFVAKHAQGILAKESVLHVVHLTFDAGLTDKRMGLKAYIVQKGKLPNGTAHCAIFVPIDVELLAFEPESVGIAAITPGLDAAKNIHLTSGIDQIKKSTDQMLAWIDKLQKYIDDVISKKKPGDVNIGRKLNELVTNVKQLQPGQFENMVNTGMKDFLMIAYLAELAKTELKLYEKLTSV